jgi:hypothetical protein
MDHGGPDLGFTLLRYQPACCLVDAPVGKVDLETSVCVGWISKPTMEAGLRLRSRQPPRLATAIDALITSKIPDTAWRHLKRRNRTQWDTSSIDNKITTGLTRRKRK